MITSMWSREKACPGRSRRSRDRCARAPGACRSRPCARSGVAVVSSVGVEDHVQRLDHLVVVHLAPSRPDMPQPLIRVTISDERRRCADRSTGPLSAGSSTRERFQVPLERLPVPAHNNQLALESRDLLARAPDQRHHSQSRARGSRFTRSAAAASSPSPLPQRDVLKLICANTSASTRFHRRRSACPRAGPRASPLGRARTPERPAPRGGVRHVRKHLGPRSR